MNTFKIQFENDEVGEYSCEYIRFFETIKNYFELYPDMTVPMSMPIIDKSNFENILGDINYYMFACMKGDNLRKYDMTEHYTGFILTHTCFVIDAIDMDSVELLKRFAGDGENVRKYMANELIIRRRLYANDSVNCFKYLMEECDLTFEMLFDRTNSSHCDIINTKKILEYVCKKMVDCLENVVWINDKYSIDNVFECREFDVKCYNAVKTLMRDIRHSETPLRYLKILKEYGLPLNDCTRCSKFGKCNNFAECIAFLYENGCEFRWRAVVWNLTQDSVKILKEMGFSEKNDTYGV